MISELPMSGDRLNHNFLIDGRPPILPGEEPDVETRTIAGDYFRTMGIPLLQGRDFSSQDREDTPMVGLVNESFVREFFPDENPIGARISWARGPRNWMTIVGVVGDVKHYGFNLPELPAFYNSYIQLDQPWKRWMEIVARGPGGSPGLAELVRKEQE
jgi:hypothetical protein